MNDQLLTPAEVARIFGVGPKTVTRWAQAGKLPFTRTMGGHRRYRRSDVENLIAAHASPRAEDDLPPPHQDQDPEETVS